LRPERNGIDILVKGKIEEIFLDERTKFV